MTEKRRLAGAALSMALLVVGVGTSPPTMAAAADPGLAASMFVRVDLDLTGATEGVVACKHDLGVFEKPVLLEQYAYERVTGGWARDYATAPLGHMGVSSHAQPVDAGVQVVGTRVQSDPPANDATWLGTDTLTVRFDATKITRVAFTAASWHGILPSCSASVDGVNVPVEHLTLDRARAYHPDQFDGVAGVSVRGALAASVMASHRHEVSGFLNGVFTTGHPANVRGEPVTTTDVKTTEPDGTVTVGDQEFHDGDPGTWTFEATGAYAGDLMPMLMLLDLPTPLVP